MFVFFFDFVVVCIMCLIVDCVFVVVFQLIVDFGLGMVVGYEGLICGLCGIDFELFVVLFVQVVCEGEIIVFEWVVVFICFDVFVVFGCDGKLFFNFSVGMIFMFVSECECICQFFGCVCVGVECIVIEFIEQNVIFDVVYIGLVVVLLCDVGIQFVFDDYGIVNVSMNLWLCLYLDVVKIDCFFIYDIVCDLFKFEVVKVMQYFVQVSGV